MTYRTRLNTNMCLFAALLTTIAIGAMAQGGGNGGPANNSGPVSVGKGYCNICAPSSKAQGTVQSGTIQITNGFNNTGSDTTGIRSVGGHMIGSDGKITGGI